MTSARLGKAGCRGRSRTVGHVLQRSSCVGLLLLLAVGGRPEFPLPSRWYPVCQGVVYGRAATQSPRPLHAHFLRVDLEAKGLSFLATPSAGAPDGHTLGMKTSTFLERYRLQAAVNAAPFGPIWKEEGKPVKNVGLTVSKGKVVSPATALPALVITRRNEARIVAPPFRLENVYTAVAGFGIVLRKGVVVGKNDQLHPRTGAGISADGRYLYLMVVDGRQPKYSEGITTAEVGAWLLTLGCHDGINLDGGGTSTLVVEDAWRTPRVMNMPIHDGMPGRERVAGSHLGIRARRLRGGPVLPPPWSEPQADLSRTSDP